MGRLADLGTPSRGSGGAAAGDGYRDAIEYRASAEGWYWLLPPFKLNVLVLVRPGVVDPCGE